MRIKIAEAIVLIILSAIVLGTSVASSSLIRTKTIAYYGQISARALNTTVPVGVNVDFSQGIGVNNLSLGIQTDFDWSALVSNSKLQQEFAACKFSFVRFFASQTQPCTSWNESTLIGIYDWSHFDQLMQTFQKTNANILIAVTNNPGGLPNGMEENYNNTAFPNPTSFAAYCKDIALHIKTEGWVVKYWEPYNEPYQVFDNDTAFNAFVNLFNQASDSVLQVLPEAQLGVCASNSKAFLERFAHVARNVGFLAFHKYDASGTLLYNPQNYYSDDEILAKASGMENSELYTPEEMQNVWFSITGVALPVFCTETNLNSAFTNGTDPRIQQIIGGVWYAEEVRGFLVNNVSASIYYSFASDDSPRWDIDKQTKGYGFGMVNITSPNQEWYPYLVNFMIGNSLDIGDELYLCTSTNSTEVSAIAWTGSNNFNILLIGKVNETVNVALDIEKVDLGHGTGSIARINGLDSTIQTSEIDLLNPANIQENGLFVDLIRLPIS